jgi:hypothetical protein
VRLSIRQPFASCAFDGLRRAFGVFHAQCDPLVVSEIEFAKIPFQVVLADVVKRADNPALEDREIALDGVGVVKAASANIFLD